MSLKMEILFQEHKFVDGVGYSLGNFVETLDNNEFSERIIQIKKREEVFRVFPDWEKSRVDILIVDNFVPICDYCKEDVNVYGGLSFSPPEPPEFKRLNKYHICVKCFIKVKPIDIPVEILLISKEHLGIIISMLKEKLNEPMYRIHHSDYHDIFDFITKRNIGEKDIE